MLSQQKENAAAAVLYPKKVRSIAVEGGLQVSFYFAYPHALHRGRARAKERFTAAEVMEKKAREMGRKQG